MCKFVYDELGSYTPIHFLISSRLQDVGFGLAPVETLEKHHCIAREGGLNCAYIGNVPGRPLEHTYCPECKNIAIERYGFIMN